MVIVLPLEGFDTVDRFLTQGNSSFTTESVYELFLYHYLRVESELEYLPDDQPWYLYPADAVDQSTTLPTCIPELSQTVVEDLLTILNRIDLSQHELAHASYDVRHGHMYVLLCPKRR